jgi:hypothetical protein
MSTTPDPSKLSPDPRLYSPATYSRDAVVANLVSLYESLPHIDPSEIHHAPPGGWPEINSASIAAHGIRKTDEAVELLRRLPYIDGSCPWVEPDAFPVDYRAVISALGNNPWLWELQDKNADPARFPPWVVQLTTGM